MTTKRWYVDKREIDLLLDGGRCHIVWRTHDWMPWRIAVRNWDGYDPRHDADDLNFARAVTAFERWEREMQATE